MLARNSPQQDKQYKDQIQSDGEESLSVQIQPQKKQMTTHTDFSIKYEEDQKKILLYVELDPKNIINLTKQISRGQVFDDQRKFYKNCIMFKKIITPQSNKKGSFIILYSHYRGLTFTISFKKGKQTQQLNGQQQELQYQLVGRIKLYYKTVDGWETMWLENEQTTQNKRLQFNFDIGASSVQKILKQKLLLQIFMEKYYNNINNEYRGILNQGNTCYANTTLQVLYHFVPLRKMIIQLPSNKLNKLTKALQQIFVDMMTSKSTVRAQQLLNFFQKMGNNPHRQQDIHEFLISIFDQLQKQLPEAANFWTGRDHEITESKEPKYFSKQQQNFTQLQLLMADSKGVNFGTISQSFMQLIQQDIADQPIDTQQFGKIVVTKSRYFQALPPLLFVNIKRYEYNPKRKELKKINMSLTYPKDINLDFLMKTAEGLQYVLYSVVVHKGKSPNSGHYFCFINLSKQVDQTLWYQFNDSTVRLAQQNRVLNNFTGKKKTVIQLNKQYGKWAQVEQYSQQTAYLLVYMRKELFKQFQNIEVRLPSWQIQRLQQKLTQQQSKTMASVKVYVLQDTSQFRPFQLSSVQLQQIKLIKSETLQQQLKKFEKHLCCKIGTIWKVNSKTKTIKHIHKEYGEECRITVGRHTQCKRGIRQPDYFIIIPEQKMKQVQQYQKRNLGILHLIQINEVQTIEHIQVLSKQDILKKLQQLKKDSANIQYEQDELQYFIHGWNGYICVQKS